MCKKDLAGQKFERLTAIQPIGKNKSGNTIWECQCDCGNFVRVINSNLSRGNSKSCGCIGSEKTIARNTKYPNKNNQIYSAWKGMKNRCLTKSSTMYRYYGGRGIVICDEWFDFNNFQNWAANSGFFSGATLDRIDFNGHYEPANCRWVTQLEQANNKSNNRYLTYQGTTASLASICRHYNANYKRVWKRLKRGWELERALLTK